MDRVRIEITGIVQGVGFRPFVYNLARSMGICGFVLNNPRGVTIEAEGEDIDGFIRGLKTSAPPLARIEEIKASKLLPAGYKNFEIKESLAEGNISTHISPDIAICKDCLKELLDPSDRRYLYPFINCTNCGPRYSIVLNIPYDRHNTTMSPFRLCKRCEEEYHNPSNRRFHAQPNACPECGPRVWLKISGKRLTDTDAILTDTDAIRKAVELLKDGAIVAIKGLGGFHLACDATNDSSVKKLREGKRKSNKPFAIMAGDISSVRTICEVGKDDEELLESPKRPIVIMEKKAGNPVSDAVSPWNNTLGVMLPYTPLHYLLFYYPLTHNSSLITHHCFDALVMTSGNLSEEPIVTHNREALKKLTSIADAFLLHNRDIYMRVDDSVIWGQKSNVGAALSGCPVRGQEERQSMIIRRARGYVPSPIDLGNSVPQVFAAGGELKTTLCLTKGRHAILSQHIGDMENKEAIEFYRETFNNLMNTFKVEPEMVAHDLHPNFWTTGFAREIHSSLSLPPSAIIQVQHHHAHIASCMAEHGLRGKVIGIALDGTGYGVDGKVWGGEFLIADERESARFAHLDYVPMPGGDRAIKAPFRMALSYLYHAVRDEAFNFCPSFFTRFDPRILETLINMIKGGINSPLTSSCGRLFDAVSSILGIKDVITFEGEAAIAMEMVASHDAEGSYGFEIKGVNPCLIDVTPMIRYVVEDMKKRKNIADIAGRFHNTLVEIILEVSRMARRKASIKRVVLSGGCFHNALLLRKAASRLESVGFDVFTHRIVPPNDGGISLGQALVATSC